MDYKNLKKYEGDMVASDLCDAIVEARMCDLPEIRNAAMLLVEDLQSAILNSENLYYFTSNYTRSVYINERFSTFVFDDRYYAEKFVEQHPNLRLDIADISQKEFESFFIALYQQGIEAIDYCNDRSNVTMGIAKYFLSDSYNPNEAPARDLSRFIHLCMQELRNEERQYEKKEDIINLLKRNIIAEALNCNVFIPVQSNAAVTQLKLDGSEQFAAMQLPNEELFFPVFTSTYEFAHMKIPGCKFVSTPLLSYIEFIRSISATNKHIIGLAVNPEHCNFALNQGIMNLVVINKENMAN